MPDGLAWNYIQPISLGDAAISTANIYNASKQGVNDSLSRLKQFGEAAIANEANRQAEGKLEQFMAALQKHNQAYINNPTNRQSPEQQRPVEIPVEAIPQPQSQQPKSTAIPVQQGNGLAIKAPVKAAAPYMDMFKAASAKYGVPLDVLLAVAQTESDFNPHSVSSTGVRGIMQVTGDTYRGLGFTGDRADPNNSIQAGAKLLSQLYGKYGDWDNVFYAYNGGHNAVTGIRDGNWGVWANNPGKIKEITNYAPKVNRYRQGWAGYNG